jgi:DNA-binding NarL/FixJ family response regulator
MTVGTETAEGSGLIRVLIADDQDLFRSALGQLLTEAPDLEVVGEAGDGAEAVRLVGNRKPDIVLMDVRMPTLSGIEATRRLTRDHPEVKVLILTSFDADAYVVDALRAGADGYVLKDSSPDAIAASIRAVISSEKVMSRQVADRRDRRHRVLRRAHRPGAGGPEADRQWPGQQADRLRAADQREDRPQPHFPHLREAGDLRPRAGGPLRRPQRPGHGVDDRTAALLPTEQATSPPPKEGRLPSAPFPFSRGSACSGLGRGSTSTPSLPLVE